MAGTSVADSKWFRDGPTVWALIRELVQGADDWRVVVSDGEGRTFQIDEAALRPDEYTIHLIVPELGRFKDA